MPRHRPLPGQSDMRPSSITSIPGWGDRGVCLFVAVFIQIGEGACACPSGSAYPHYCSLLTRVDSAEADQVGSQRFRFFAYVGLTIDEGVRHYRTTPGALSFFLNLLVVVSAIAGSDSFH